MASAGPSTGSSSSSARRRLRVADVLAEINQRCASLHASVFTTLKETTGLYINEHCSQRLCGSLYVAYTVYAYCTNDFSAIDTNTKILTPIVNTPHCESGNIMELRDY